MNLLQLLMRSSWKFLSLAIVAGIVSGMSTAALLSAMNAQLNQSSSSLLLVLSFTGLCFLRFLSNVVAQVMLIRLSQKSILNLRLQVCRQILTTSLYHLEQLGTPRLLVALTDDIQSIAATVLILPNLCISVAISLCCAVYLYWLSPTVFALSAAFLGLGIISYQLPARTALAFMAQARGHQDQLYQHFRSITEGIKELKLHRRKRRLFFNNDLQTAAKAYQKNNISGMTLFAIASSWSHVLFFIAIGVILFALPRLGLLEPKVLSGYVLTISYLIMPLDSIMRTLPAISKAIVAVDKIQQLNLQLSDTERESTISLDDLYCHTLTLKQVSHTYYTDSSDLPFSFGPAEITFIGGEIVFITGGNGSGKSSFIKLLTGLYLPEHGSIYLNKESITAQTWDWYRQHFSVIFSDYYLFDRLSSISKNVCDPKINQYLIELQLDHKVTTKNGVLSTIALSQGQRKRLALLTAYLEDRPIYVFDEWASDQDPSFKNVFYTQILPDLKKKGKTVIAVTHDDQYFYLADRIIKLNDGKIEYDRYQSNQAISVI
ncbi:cyclic peptide export ABC transporter [Leptothoe sp. EHU-05/26/07-4]